MHLSRREEEDVQALRDRMREMETQAAAPSEADRMRMEDRAGAEMEAKWRDRVEQAMEDVEASKVSVQGLLQENLCLRVALQQVGREAEEAAAEGKAIYEGKVRTLERMVREMVAEKQPRVEQAEREADRLQREEGKLKSKVKVGGDSKLVTDWLLAEE